MNNDLHGSHLPILVKAIERVPTKPVLELGMGWNSTPILHWLCKDQGRYLMSVDTDPKWITNFEDYRSETHDIFLHTREESINTGMDKLRWGVVLIDGRPARHRHKFAIKFKYSADIVIIHDSEPEINKFYRYDRIWDHYRYRYDYKKFKPYTTVLSNKIDVEENYEKLR